LFHVIIKKIRRIEAMKKSIHFFVLCLFCIVGLLFLQSCKEPPKKEVLPKPVKAIRIGDVERLSQRAFPGRAEAEQEATLSFRVSGQMLKRNVNMGDKVEKGKVLAQLDPADFKNVLNVARGGLAKAEAALEDAAADYARATSVQDEDAGAISQQYVDRTKAARSVAQAARDSAGSAVKIAQDRLDYAMLKAPFSGEIVATYAEAFETVVAKQPIMRLLDQGSIEFKVDVPESLIGYANQVVSAEVRFDIKPDIPIAATIKEVGREASQGTRTYPVTLLLQSTDKFEVLPGMAGKAFIRARPPEDAPQMGTVIPAAALFSGGEENQSFVWIIADNTLQQRQVTVGLPSDYGVRVKSGLNPGDWIVIAGVHSLSEGQPVRVIDATASKETP
jgi:RND family efflux transporter MFP subunit